MAFPALQSRKDLVVMVAWNATTPAVYTNWCGATGIRLSINNNISEQVVADCEDWSLPAQIVRAYGCLLYTSPSPRDS